MISPAELLQMQRDQHGHDSRNHSDILCLHKTDRLKHYGLHYAKYLGRLARETAEPKPVSRTIVDSFLVNLSAANALQQNLSTEQFSERRSQSQIDPLRIFADSVGRFADACEKIDHMEEFVSQARTANRDVTEWLLNAADENGLELADGLRERRRELAARHFYIAN